MRPEAPPGRQLRPDSCLSTLLQRFVTGEGIIKKNDRIFVVYIFVYAPPSPMDCRATPPSPLSGVACVTYTGTQMLVIHKSCS
jgi:hypothetical protein